MGRINRRAHVLRREKTLAIPRHVVFIDTETEPEKHADGSESHKLILGWACYLRRGGYDRKDKYQWLEFTDAETFWDWLNSFVGSKNKLWVIAHNIGFDFTVLEGFRFLRQAGFKCRFFYTGGSTTLIRVKKPGASIFFVDSLNWFHESLKSLGDRLGLEKLKIDFETADRPTLSKYCHRDVEILIKVFQELVSFLQTNRISRLTPTIGSLAFASYLFRDYDVPIYIHNDVQAIDLERAAYKGGRTECFFIGELSNGPYYCLDVNSLYPYVMRINRFPTKYEKVKYNLSIDDLRMFLQTKSVIAEITLQTDEPVYAVRRKRTIFPTGVFSTTLSSPELLYAVDHGHIVSVETAVIYESDSIFKSFVDRFYRHRTQFAADNNKLYEHFCKIIMNSLYGKFGQKAEQWEKIGDCPNEPDRLEDCIDGVTHRRRRIRYLLGEVFEMTGWTESRHSFPAIAAHVTAYARLFLWDLMKRCGKGNYFYCDTDSLFVNVQGFVNLASLVDPNVLGMLKVESIVDTLTIYGLKDYKFGDRTVIKGIRKNAVRVSDIEYVQEKWPSIKGILRSGKPDRYPILKTTKHLYRDYSKGVVSKSGFVQPFDFDELDSQPQQLF